MIAFRAWLREARAWVNEIGLRDAFVFGGLAVFARGAHDIYPPAAWLVVGAVCFGMGMRMRE